MSSSGQAMRSAHHRAERKGNSPALAQWRHAASAPAELRRILPHLVLQPDVSHHFKYALLPDCPRSLCQLERQSHISISRPVADQLKMLKDHADRPSRFPKSPASERGKLEAVHLHAARIGALQHIHQTQQRRLSGSAWTDDSMNRSLSDVEGYIVYHLIMVITINKALIHLLQRDQNTSPLACLAPSHEESPRGWISLRATSCNNNIRIIP